MATPRLLVKTITSAANLSGGAILALHEPRSSPQPLPEIARSLLRLVAETTVIGSASDRDCVAEAEKFLAAACQRHGTLGEALRVMSEGTRRHHLIALDKCRGWVGVVGASAATVDAALRKSPSFSLHLGKWIAAQGSTLDARLDAYDAWLSGPVSTDHLEGVLDKPAESRTPAPARESMKVDADDLQEAERRLLGEKPLHELGAHAPPRRLGDDLRAFAEALAKSEQPLAQLIGAIALRDFAKADELLPTLRERLHPADFWRLWGDRYWFDAKHERAAESYRSSRLARDAAPIRIDLACAVVRAGKPSSEDAHREAIDLLADALKHCGDDRPTCLRLHALLGSVWLHNPAGDRDANIRRAIEHLEEAVGLTEPASDPDWWAHIHVDLGSSWMALPTGKKVENVQRAVTCFDRAASIWTRQRDPERWALTQNCLAQAWERLPAGDRAANLHRAVDHIRAALEVRTREAHPAAWATLQNNLGNTYVQLPDGDHAANIRAAIECEEAALEVWSRLEKRADWAATQNNLGNAWALLPAHGEERERNLRRAIAAYKSALEVRTRSGAPSDWASTLNNMGSALMHLPSGAKGSGMLPGVDALNEAINCFERALEVRTREAFPLDWAKTQTNLGQAWSRRPAPGRMDHLRSAIECYNRALTVFRADTHPHQHRHVSDRRAEAQDLLDELQLLG